jgi:hypothetical protein
MTGFDYVNNMPPSIMDWRVISLSSLGDICNSGMFQAVQYVAPEGLESLTAKQSYLTLIQGKPGTVFYAARAYEQTSGLDFTFRVYDNYGEYLADTFVRPSYAQDLLGSTVSRLGLPYQMFNQPIYLPTGHIKVEISNPNSSTIKPQLVLIGLEPVSALGDVASALCGA